jgi:thymidylate kinase
MAELFVFEGPDGVGKSTVISAVEKHLRDAGVVCTRLSFPGNEPGTLGRHVYDLHHAPGRYGVEQMSPVSLQLLHIAAHIDAIERRILPLLRSGTTVLLDRYWWSTWVYGTVGGVPAAQLDAMLAVERHAWQGVQPASVFLLKRPDAARDPVLVEAYDRLAQREADCYPVVPLHNERSVDATVQNAVQIIMRMPRPNGGVSPLVQEPNQSTTDVVIGDPKTRGGRAPLVFARLEPAKPSKVYDTYWRFAAERQAIFFRRFRGETGRLTDDPILAQYKFTNAYRASDRVSQFLIRHVIYGGEQTHEEVFFRTILFKLFNRIDTWRLLEEVFGTVCYAEYRFDRYDTVLSRALASGARIYSAAYIMPAASAFGPDDRKHRTHLRLLEKMMADEVPRRLAEARSMRHAFELLRSYPMLGDFLAYQFVTDLNYSEITNFSEMDFVIPGPGARDGIRKCFKSTGGLAEADLIRLVTDRQQVEFERLGISFQSLWGRPLQLIDCQNLFCEVDKYARLAHPDVVGVSGRTRIKQLYRPTPTPITYWYPPKWGINDAIEREQAGIPAMLPGG